MQFHLLAIVIGRQDLVASLCRNFQGNSVNFLRCRTKHNAENTETYKLILDQLGVLFAKFKHLDSVPEMFKEHIKKDFDKEFKSYVEQLTAEYEVATKVLS